jgi:hypothetical protein
MLRLAPWRSQQIAACGSLDEALHGLAQPVIAPSSFIAVQHALLDDAPAAGRREHEAVVIELVAVLQRGVVDLGGELAGADQRCRLAREGLAGGGDLGGRFARDSTLAAGDVEAEIRLAAAHRLLERAAGRGGDAARVPVEAQDASQRLEPERVGEAAQHLVAAVLGHQVAKNLAREQHHAGEQPGRRAAAVQGQLGEPGALGAVHASI